MDNTNTEVTRSYVPSLPTREPEKGQSLFAKVKAAVGKIEAGVSNSPDDEIKAKTHELFERLLDRVELRIDIHRKEKSQKIGEQRLQTQTVEDKVRLARQGRLKEILGATNQWQTAIAARALEEDRKILGITEGRIEELMKVPGVQAEYNKFRHERIDKLRSAREAAEELEAIKQLGLQQEKMARQVFLEQRTYSPGEEAIIKESQAISDALKERVDELVKDPEVFDLVRLRQLQEYQRGLRQDRFAETPSRQGYVDQVREAWAQGKKVLLTGPTGSGKTELLLHGARSLFGEEAERLTGHELMTNYEVYGKVKGGTREGQITLMFGSAPFVRALQKNVPFVFDEINVVPNRVLMRLKTDLNARIGQTITIQEDSDEKVTVGDRFAIGATANVKSEKHVDREKLDPALVRMFEPVKVDYMPPHELYDMMLAGLMDFQGGVHISKYDALIPLRALCNATAWTQKAYLGESVVIDPGIGKVLEARGGATVGKQATLREAVLDPGRALDMLVGWEDARQKGMTLREFLDKRVVAFINNENYPEEDRYYLTEIFALQGFLGGVDVNDLQVSGLDQTTLDAWSGYDKKRRVSKINYLPPDEVAKLDPYGVSKRPVKAEAADLLDEVETEEFVEILAPTPTAIPRSSHPERMAGTGARAARISSTTMDADAKRRLDILDKIYPPDEISGKHYGVKFGEYPDKLVEVARLSPATALAVVERFTKTLMNGSDSTDIDMLAERLEKFYEIAGKLPGVNEAMAGLLAEINRSENWKSGPDYYKARRKISDLEGKLFE